MNQKPQQQLLPKIDLELKYEGIISTNAEFILNTTQLVQKLVQQIPYLSQDDAKKLIQQELRKARTIAMSLEEKQRETTNIDQPIMRSLVLLIESLEHLFTMYSIRSKREEQ